MSNAVTVLLSAWWGLAEAVGFPFNSPGGTADVEACTVRLEGAALLVSPRITRSNSRLSSGVMFSSVNIGSTAEVKWNTVHLILNWPQTTKS